MSQIINNGGLIIIMLCGLVYCFFGYRFFKFLLTVAGAIIFGTVAWTVSLEFFEDQQAVCIIISLAASILGAWIFHKLFKVAAFLYGAACGFGLSPLIMPFVNTDITWLKWVIPLTCALVGGLLLLFSHRLLLIIITAVSGALYFTLSLFRLLIEFDVFDEETLSKPDNVQIALWLICFFSIFLSGLVFQLKDKNSQESE